MADQFERSEDDGSGGSFMIGLLTGTVLGAGLSMLFTPKAGSVLRNQLSEQANNLRSVATESARKAADSASQLVEKGRDAASAVAEKLEDMVDRAGDSIKSGAEEAPTYRREARGVTVAPTPAAGRSSGSTGSIGGSVRNPVG